MTTTLDEPTSAVDPTAGNRNDKSRAERRLGWYLAGPAFAVMLLVTAYPIVKAIYDSLFDYRLTDPENSSFVGLGNYGVILTDSVWWTSFGVTVFITVVTVAVELVHRGTWATASPGNQAHAAPDLALRTAVAFAVAAALVVVGQVVFRRLSGRFAQEL